MGYLSGPRCNYKYLCKREAEGDLTQNKVM